MSGYILNFMVYTLAMVGVIYLCLIVVKKSTNFESAPTRKKSLIKLESKLNLSQRKSVYILNVENERFLIASDTERTSFLAKLEPKEIETETETEAELKSNNQIQDLKTEEFNFTIKNFCTEKSNFSKNLPFLDETETRIKRPEFSKNSESVFRRLLAKI